MIVISHRGYWRTPSEKNSEIAFRRSASLNFGTETDVRDCLGKLVVAHDLPNGNEIGFASFLGFFESKSLLLAVNIKADGLADQLKKAMINYPRQAWFAFDMSIPDMRAHLRAGNPVFARMSEVEKEPAWFDDVAGIWLDSFKDQWYDTQLVRHLIEKGKRVCVVSPELHGRNHETLWEILLPLASLNGLILCTDIPEAAQEYFERSKNDQSDHI